MIGPRKAIYATVLAPSVRIDAGIEADVGAFVVGDNRASRVLQKNGVARRIVRIIPFRDGVFGSFKTIARIGRGSPPVNCFRFLHWLLLQKQIEFRFNLVFYFYRSPGKLNRLDAEAGLFELILAHGFIGPICVFAECYRYFHRLSLVADPEISFHLILIGAVRRAEYRSIQT